MVTVDSGGIDISLTAKFMKSRGRFSVVILAVFAAWFGLCDMSYAQTSEFAPLPASPAKPKPEQKIAAPAPPPQVETPPAPPPPPVAATPSPEPAPVVSTPPPAPAQEAKEPAQPAAKTEAKAAATADKKKAAVEKDKDDKKKKTVEKTDKDEKLAPEPKPEKVELKNAARLPADDKGPRAIEFISKCLDNYDKCIAYVGEQAAKIPEGEVCIQQLANDQTEVTEKVRKFITLRPGIYDQAANRMVTEALYVIYSCRRPAEKTAGKKK
jgi:hypothetical protein